VIKLAQDQKEGATPASDSRPIKVASLTLSSGDGYTDTSN
jgi:hypothetical protein